MNLNLIKCAFEFHNYDEPIKDYTLDKLVKICKYCNFTKHITILNGESTYETSKQEIINDINLDKLHHAKVKLNMLIKKFF